MRTAFIGIGGVGGYYGGKLAYHYSSHQNIEVIFIARGKHLEQIRKQGLTLITTDSDYIATPSIATDDPKKLGILDLVIFCVKGYDLEQSARILSNNLNKESVVLPLMNGVNNATLLKSFLPVCKILNGCVYISAHIVKPGVVRQVGGSCQLLFGPEEGNTEDFMKIEQVFKNAGIKAELKTNIKEIVWEKYIFISPLASVTSLFGESFGAVMEKKESKDLIEGLMREVELIARAGGVNLAKDIVEMTLDKVSKFPYETKSSMQVDCENGKKTELVH